MAATYDNSASLGNVTASSQTVAYTVGSGSNRRLWVGFQIESGSDLATGVTYNGVAMTQAVKKQSSTAIEYVYLYFLDAPASGSNNVVISLSGSSTINSFAISFSDALQSGTTDSTGSATSASANTLTLTTTVVASGCVLVGMFGFAAGGTISAGAGTTLAASSGSRGIGYSTSEVGTGSQSLVYNETSTSEITGVIASMEGASGYQSGFTFLSY